MLKGFHSTLPVGTEVIYQSASFCSHLKAKTIVAFKSEMAVLQNAVITNLQEKWSEKGGWGR